MFTLLDALLFYVEQYLKTSSHPHVQRLKLETVALKIDEAILSGCPSWHDTDHAPIFTS